MENIKKEETKKMKSKRCKQCNKKTGLNYFECKCGNEFCAEHRYSYEHNCSFDHKKIHLETIKNNNPLIVAAKMEKL